MRTFRVLTLLLTFVSFPVRPETVRYKYDEAGRLSRVEYSSGRTITYSYDKAGNLIHRQVETGEAPAAQAKPPAAKKAGRK
jgi:hypothetical protein